MKHLLVLTTALALVTSPALATLQISFSNGASTFFCADQTACDLDGAQSNLLLLNTVVGNIKIEGTFAVSTTSPDELSVSNLTITNLSNTTQTLNMAVGDTDFLAPVATVRSSASLTFLNDNGGSGTLAFYADTGNSQPASTVADLPGVQLFSVSQTITQSPDSFSGTHGSVFLADSPFSMSEGASLQLVGGASITGFNQSMTASIPEPQTWALMGLGFVAVGLVGMRRRFA